MTDASRRQPLVVAALPPEPLMQIEIWSDPSGVERRLGMSLPAAGRAATLQALRLMWWEPKVWLIRGFGDDSPSILAKALGDDGAAVDVSGAFARLRITGPAWRDLLMIGGVFDAESPSFGPGCLVGTMIHHLPVRLDVIDPHTIDAYTPPSYAADLKRHWESAVRRIETAGP